MKEIKLNKGYVALVDDEDYWRLVTQFGRWYVLQSHANGNYYGVRAACDAGNHKHLLMHRVVMGNPPADRVVDHINGNQLDNRKCNLRVVTHSENSKNRRFRHEHDLRKPEEPPPLAQQLDLL